MKPDVDAVIVTFASAGELAACIEAARAWPRLARVVVVDNASPDGSAEVARGLADDVVALEENVGFGAGQNLGVRTGDAPYLLMLNPDARVHPAGLEAGHRWLQEHPSAAMTEGSIHRTGDGREERWSGREPGLSDLCARLLRLRERFGEECLKTLAPLLGAGHFAARGVDEPTAVDFLAAVAPLVRRDAFEGVGGFDDRYFLYAEDVDLSRRLRRAGKELVALPVLWADHLGAASSRRSAARRERLWWESHLRLAHDHWRGPRRWLGVAVGSAGLSRARRQESRRP